ncbi:hypothetical protein [Lentibacillus jeotgali]|uniref:hypothetical protein n=1 Tax=Lentibacillus jeotgali TaxID=558169 RepID=UPI0002628C0F|nr:hypothetical protein [Lentibacillus jeotgali]
MAFPIFFFLTWLVGSIFAVMRKKLSLVENTFVFLIILIVSINFSWIIADELKLITVTKQTLPHTAYLINRSVIIPVLILIQLNISMARDSFGWKTMMVLFSVLLLTGVNYLMTALNMVTYTNWNLGFDAIYFLLLNLAAFLAYRIMEKASEKAVNQT